MTINITIRKLHLAIAVLAVALIAPATAAVAFHVFDDVPDDRFYSDAVEWAFANGITTGTSATTFEPDRGVTRGENVTFAKRYDDNIVQPALGTLMTIDGDLENAIDTNTATIAANATAVATLQAAMPIAVSADGDQHVDLAVDDSVVRSVELEAAATGRAIVTASGYFNFSATGEDVARCSITDGSNEIDFKRLIIATAPVDSPSLFPDEVYQSFSSTVLYPVTAGSSTFNLICEEGAGSDVSVGDTILTAHFVPSR